MGCFSDTEHPREKKAKMNSLEEEAGSSLSDKSCFVALVTASNLRTDTLVLYSCIDQNLILILLNEWLFIGLSI